jgi:hypothetical protein
MDPLQEVLAPMTEIGPDISAIVYKLPPGVKAEIIMGIVAMEPRLSPILKNGKAKIRGAMAGDGSESVIALGGYVPAAILEHVHSVIMSVGGVEFIVGAGPECRGLPSTTFGRAAAGAHARSMASSEKKPWWKVW